MTRLPPRGPTTAPTFDASSFYRPFSEVARVGATVGAGALDAASSISISSANSVESGVFAVSNVVSNVSNVSVSFSFSFHSFVADAVSSEVGERTGGAVASTGRAARRTPGAALGKFGPVPFPSFAVVRLVKLGAKSAASQLVSSDSQHPLFSIVTSVVSVRIVSIVSTFSTVSRGGVSSDKYRVETGSTVL
jgi:hypothetical protein